MLAERELVTGRARICCALIAVTWVLCPTPGATAQATIVKIDIGQSEIGAAPTKFDFSPRGASKRGSWTVVHDPTAETGVAIEQVGVADEERPALAVYKPVSTKNAAISFRVNAAGGKSDQGGGVAVRLSDPHNYYLVQLDALRDQVLLTCVCDDASEEIAAVDADSVLDHVALGIFPDQGPGRLERLDSIRTK